MLLLRKNVDFLQKKVDISKIKEILVLKDFFFSETIYVCVLLTCQISSFLHNPKKIQTEGRVILPPPPPQNEPLKSQPRVGLSCWEIYVGEYKYTIYFYT